MPAGVVDGDLEPGIDRVLQVAHPEEDAGVASLGELVVEVEHEVAVGLLVDDDVAARAVRVQAVGLDVRLGERLAGVGLPALGCWCRRRSS